MDVISGLLILFGLFTLGRSGYEAFTGVEDAWSTAAVGLFFTVIGVVFANQKRKFKSAPAEPVETAVEAVKSVMPEEPKEAIFSIIQTGDDDVVDRVERLLESVSSVRTVVSETGQWYSTPDRDDLPEWNALRVYCDAASVDQVMEEVSQLIKDKLGETARNKVNIQHYS